ncbi:hypothetical protein [Mariniradius sediminis]|uniref:Uncharacterized protein n=1 Tax=Mariniradius sediminis TaxID=2909237 RepID=A0ABS9BQI2_9BACT|nr:hypothetical protein [Mariniradius sediminis]MCF1749600.1 hypothetical protein [Mariniradius sediminis]
MKSDKRKRFEKVAENRVEKILDGLRLLGNCSNRNNYEFTKDDVDYMFDEIRRALKDTQSKFESEFVRNEQRKFKFK